MVEPVASTLRALVERERARGALIADDPNIRLNVEPDLARWRDQLDWMLPRTHLLKISDEDLGLLLPGTGARRVRRRARWPPAWRWWSSRAAAKARSAGRGGARVRGRAGAGRR